MGEHDARQHRGLARGDLSRRLQEAHCAVSRRVRMAFQQLLRSRHHDACSRPLRHRGIDLGGVLHPMSFSGGAVPSFFPVSGGSQLNTGPQPGTLTSMMCGGDGELRK